MNKKDNGSRDYMILKITRAAPLKNQFIQQNYKWVLFIIFFMLTLLIGIIFGWVYHGMQIKDNNGISFYCNSYTANHFNRNGCSANIILPQSNVEIQITSNFDTLTVTN